MKKEKPSPIRIDITRQEDWEKQSERDLEISYICKKNEYYEWCCYCAQQSAEKALKAVLCKLGIVEKHITGHDLVYVARFIPIRLVGNIEKLEDDCAYLKKYNIKARYPDKYLKGYPGDTITRVTAEEALKATECIRRECEEIKQFLDTIPSREDE